MGRKKEEEIPGPEDGQMNIFDDLCQQDEKESDSEQNCITNDRSDDEDQEGESQFVDQPETQDDVVEETSDGIKEEVEEAPEDDETPEETNEGNVDTSENAIVYISPHELHPNPKNPMLFNAESKNYKQIRKSIEEVGQIIEALIATWIDGVLTIVSGECRWHAALELHMETIPVRIVELEPHEMYRIMLDANLHRTAVTIAEMIRTVRMEKENWEGEDRKLSAALAEKYGRVQRTIQKYLKISELPDEIVMTIGTKISENSTDVILERFETIEVGRLIEVIDRSNRLLSGRDILYIIDNDYQLPDETGSKTERKHVVSFTDEECAVILGRNLEPKDIRNLRNIILEMARNRV